MPTISVIVPVYNVEQYLCKCIDSILGQTYKDFELILVDDGSPDSCPKICDDYAKKDCRVIVIHKDNGGLSSARNAGLDYVFLNSDSKYISFVDSDDYVDRLFLEKLNAGIVGCDMCVCFFARIVKDELIFSNKEIDNVFDKISYWTLQGINIVQVVAWNKLYKRELFKKIRYPVGKKCEDDFVIHYIVDECESIRIIPDQLYFYRKRDGSIMNELDKLDLDFIYLEVLVDRAVFYKDNDFMNYYGKAFYELLHLYNIDKKRANKSYKIIKSIYKRKRKLGARPTRSEMFFFLSPHIFNVLKKISVFFHC